MTDPIPPPERSLARDVDQLLRGGFTREEDLRAGKVRVPVRTLVIACIGMGAFYGLMMGLYSWTTVGSPMQAIGAAVKVPLLFLATLLVTLPSLYVFSALARSTLGGMDTMRLLLVAVGVDLAVLASFGPVTAFFTFSTDSYSFMIVLNVVFFGVAGLIGLGILARSLEFVLEGRLKNTAEEVSEETITDPLAPEAAAAARRATFVPRPASRRVFQIWLVIYGVVGAQMGWILRPFIGSPEMPFEWFREREGNFLEGLLKAMGRLFG